MAIVTRDLKYIYWAFAKKGFEPTEEFYDTKNDPGELANVIETHKDADAMRKLYDEQIAHWQKNAVPYHNYAPFAKTFARKP